MMPLPASGSVPEGELRHPVPLNVDVIRSGSERAAGGGLLHCCGDPDVHPFCSVLATVVASRCTAGPGPR